MTVKAELKTGDVYNPFKIFVGMFIPNCIAETSQLSQSAKLCFGKLAQFAGRNGKCFPKQESIGAGIGVKSIKQVQRCLKELEKMNLIRVEKPSGKDKLMHKPDSYIFLWNNLLFLGENDDIDGGDKNVPSENDEDDSNEKDDQNVVPGLDRNVASAPHRNVASNGNRIRIEIESEIKPKGFNQNSKKNFEHEEFNIDKPAEQADAKRKSVSNTQMLKDSAKAFTPIKKSVRKRSVLRTKVSEKNKTYFDILLEYKIKMPGPTTKTYAKINGCITQLRTGIFFNGLPGFKRLYDRKMTLEDIDRFCFNFTTMLGSKKYEPVNDEIKDRWRDWYFDRILYREATSSNNAYSLFADYFDRPAREVKSQIKDANPEYTELVIAMCQKEFGWDLSNGERSIAIRCASNLIKFYADNKSKINLYKQHYGQPHQQIRELLTMLDKNAYADHQPEPIYLCGDVTYNKLLPKHLKYVGSM